MVIERLSSEDQDSILQCMRAIADGPYIEDPEFQTRLGITRETLKQIISHWPNIDDRLVDSDAFLAINNCMNEVCNGVHISSEEWDTWLTRPRAKIVETYHKWLTRSGRSTAGIR